MARSLVLGLFVAYGHAPSAPPASPAASATLTVPASTKVHRVVVQVTADGEENWNAVRGQVENLRKGFAPEPVEIEIVVHGNATGLVLARNSGISERLRKVELSGTNVAYCANTQRKHDVKTEELTPGVTVIPSGIVHVIRRQEEGWSYVKAGP